MTLPTVADTRAFGARIAAVLRPGDLVVLTGPLGAGKTAFAQGVGHGLAVAGEVTSPTFVIARVHHGELPLVHVDAYRLGSVGELEDLDLEYSLDESVTLVEWGHGLVGRLAESYLEITFARLDDDTRTARLEAHGAQWKERLAHADLGD
nr:tRNA (adenosine(37)-N6)-threonylcarbamoyltransferase complex ATPase subunit type 1 TsaE [Longispora albida]